MKRTEELKRTPFRAKPMTEPKPLPGRRKRKCAVCREAFEPRNISHKVCAPECGLLLAEMVRKAQERKKDRERKQALKTKRDYVKEAQIAFNSYIRARDAKEACISCGVAFNDGVLGGGMDCGHWRSVGSAQHLRFHEDNAHAQCKKCNRYLGGAAVDYRIGLIARIGLSRVESLESDNSVPKWTKDDLLSVRDHFRAKLRELKGEKA